MSIINRIKDLFNRGHPQNATYTLTDTTLAELLGAQAADDPMSVATYMTCIKILSETMGKIPIKIIQDNGSTKTKLTGHRLYQPLNYSPNPLYNAVTLRQQAEFHRWHHGNAYIWRDQKTGWMWLLDPDAVTPMVTLDARGLVYIYRSGSQELKLLPAELVHLKSPFTDKTGIKGIPLRTYLSTMLSGQAAAEAFQKTLAESGMTGQKLLMTVGTGGEAINEGILKTTISNIEKFAKYNTGKLLPLPPFVDLKSLDLKLTDSQYMELRKLSSEQISSAFGIPPMMLNDLTKSSYSSQEMQQISFLVNTLQPILQQYEVELYNKLLSQREKQDGVYISYNTKSLLMTTAKEQAEYLKYLVDSGLMTINEARSKLEENKSDNPMANELIIANGSAIPLRDVGKQYTKGGGEA